MLWKVVDNPLHKPIFSAKIMMILSMIMTIFGIILLIISTKSSRCVYEYIDENIVNITSDICKNMNNNNTLYDPVHISYQLTSFYENNRQYYESVSYEQLQGSYDYPYKCYPYIYNNNKLLYPCGLVARSVFNDTYKLYKNNEEIYMNISNIIISHDKNRYIHQSNNTVYDWLNKVIFPQGVNSPHFVAWMRPSPIAGAARLWANVQNKTPLQLPLTLQISNNYPAKAYNTKKRVIIGTTTWSGVAVEYIGTAYTIVGTIMFILTISYRCAI
eukprot:GHVL01036931.1.p1 GENE.GHVL01036931.1~~GHVL01036931.1.p1  ORF type:complete len:272 (+),score=61.49 GHVL01036931.1:99-914(+)